NCWIICLKQILQQSAPAATFNALIGGWAMSGRSQGRLERRVSSQDRIDSLSWVPATEPSFFTSHGCSVPAGKAAGLCCWTARNLCHPAPALLLNSLGGRSKSREGRFLKRCLCSRNAATSCSPICFCITSRHHACRSYFVWSPLGPRSSLPLNHVVPFSRFC